MDDVTVREADLGGVPPSLCSQLYPTPPITRPRTGAGDLRLFEFGAMTGGTTAEPTNAGLSSEGARRLARDDAGRDQTNTNKRTAIP